MIADDVFSSAEIQLVTFNLGDERFGVDIINVQEIIRPPEITRIPYTPEYVDGITNLRGYILPIIDTRTKFGMQQGSRDEASRVIVMDVNGRLLGLNVDSVSQVMTVETRNIEAAPSSLAGQLENGLIKGVVKDPDGKNLVMILGAASMVESQRYYHCEGPGRDPINSEREADASEEIQIVSFQVGNEEYGLVIETVREIIRFPEIVKVPNAPTYIKGIISLRDSLMPIVDLRTKLEAKSDQITNGTRVVVVDINGSLVGLTVDRVFEVVRLSRDMIYPPPPAILSKSGERVNGIARLDGGKRIVMLMDFKDLVNAQWMEGLNQDAKAGEVLSELDHVETHEEQMVVLRLAGEQFGVFIHQVQEITKISTITRVPHAPSYVEGVVNLRGDVIPVLDLRKRFNMESRQYDQATRIIVSEVEQKKLGIVVDEVLEVLRVPHRCIEEAPDILHEGLQKAISGLANLNDRMLVILDLENLLQDKEWEAVRNINEQEPNVKKATGKTRMKKQGVK